MNLIYEFEGNWLSATELVASFTDSQTHFNHGNLS